MDGLKSPWCYVGDGDADWYYCEDSCAQQDSTPPAPLQTFSFKSGEAGQAWKCSVTLTGKACDAWGENDFGLDPASTACEQVDGLDRPWCYTSEEDWDYCNCDKQNAGAASPAAATKADTKPARKQQEVEAGCQDDRAETKALRAQIAQLKDNKRALELKSETPVCLQSFCCVRQLLVAFVGRVC